jgi:hypothetical protein
VVFVWRKQKLIYIAAPATGSSAFLRFVKRNKVGEFVPPRDIVEKGRKVVQRKHSTIGDLRTHGLWEDAFDGYTKAVGIRNPFAWHVATYVRNTTKRKTDVDNPKSFVAGMPWKDRRRFMANLERAENQTFEQYLQQKLNREEPFSPQEKFHEEVDVFLHQENLAAEAAQLMSSIGAPLEGDVPEFNVTSTAGRDPDKHKAYYTPELIALVYEKHAPFFKKFPEYSFDGLAAAA